MNVLITGASRGIGRATALRLAETHDVAIGYHESAEAASNVVSEATRRGASAVAVRGDVTDSAAVDRLVDEAEQGLGGLDAVVNNAGIVDPARTEALDDAQWSRVLETNLTGAFYVTRSALPNLTPGGAVVFVSSIGGTSGTVDASYAASKAGLHGLTRALAREYGDEGVRFNAVAPGPVETDMNDDILAYLESIDFRGHENVDTHLPQYACDPDDVAHTVEYILENDYLQGEIVNLNGGMQFR